MTTIALTIASTAIRQDAHWRFCLNDLHRAAGGEAKTKPSQWARTDSYKALVAELGTELRVTGTALWHPAHRNAEMHSAPVLVVNGGPQQGTYVVRELVYAYAMWISAKFHIQVIRAYDVVAARQTPFTLPHSLPEALRLAADILERAQEAEKAAAAAEEAKALADAALEAAAPKVAAFDSLVAVRTESLTQFARKLAGVNSVKIKASLEKLNYLYKAKRGYRVRSEYRDTYFEKKVAHGAAPVADIFPTSLGKQLLTRLHVQGELIMKRA